MTEAKELTKLEGILPLAKALSEPTPKEFIKQRVGRGGMTLDYVETGYVIRKLNEIFNGMWDFEIEDQQVGKEQVWVKGKLTVWLMKEVKIVKTQYGGHPIAKDRTTGAVIDIGDTLKAAASDSLKKCASMLGIAQDIYFPQLDVVLNGKESEEVVAAPVPLEEELASTGKKQRIFGMYDGLAKKKGVEKPDPEKCKEWVKAQYGLASFNDLTDKQASEIVAKLSAGAIKLVKPKEVQPKTTEEEAVATFGPNLEVVNPEEINF